MTFSIAFVVAKNERSDPERPSATTVSVSSSPFQARCGGVVIAPLDQPARRLRISRAVLPSR
jgi:hypothetical protein